MYALLSGSGERAKTSFCVCFSSMSAAQSEPYARVACFGVHILIPHSVDMQACCGSEIAVALSGFSGHGFSPHSSHPWIQACTWLAAGKGDLGQGWRPPGAPWLHHIGRAVSDMSLASPGLIFLVSELGQQC